MTTFEQRSIYSGPVRRALENLQKRIEEGGGGEPGPPGPTGPPGPAGPGVPAGGTDGQVLTKVTATNYVAAWEDPPSGGGGTGTDEVWIGPDDPITTHPTIELWVDSDAPSGGGGTGVVAYVHTQGTVAATWTVPHNLGWFPNVTVIDSGGTTVEGDVTYGDLNQLTLRFSAAFSGTAYLS